MMCRNKISKESGKVNFGITLNPEVYKILTCQSEKEKKSKSKLIEDVIDPIEMKPY
jgi:hypothetical protein